MKHVMLLTALLTLGSSQMLYSQTTRSQPASPAMPDQSHPSFTSATLSRAANETTVGSAEISTVSMEATPRAPLYPKAIQGWNVPLGQRNRTAGAVINRFIIHHTTNTGDESPYFKRKNERSSCPTWYVMSNGDVIEFIDPIKRPSSTGAANDYSLAVETQNTSRAPSWGISDASHESIAQLVAWASNQSTLGPYRVDIKLDRTHVIGHNEAGVSKTVCPGPSMRIDWIVERAKQVTEQQRQAAKP